MYHREIEFEDFNGTTRKETFYFNLSRHEVLDLEWRTPGGIENYMKTIMATLDGQKLADMFQMLIDKSYGVKSPDGRSFVKGDQILNNFKFTNAYDNLYVELATDDKAAAEFINGIFPKEAVEAARKQKELAEKSGLEIVKPEVPVDPQQAALAQMGITE